MRWCYEPMGAIHRYAYAEEGAMIDTQTYCYTSVRLLNALHYTNARMQGSVNVVVLREGGGVRRVSLMERAPDKAQPSA